MGAGGRLRTDVVAGDLHPALLGHVVHAHLRSRQATRHSVSVGAGASRAAPRGDRGARARLPGGRAHGGGARTVPPEYASRNVAW